MTMPGQQPPFGQSAQPNQAGAPPHYTPPQQFQATHAPPPQHFQPPEQAPIPQPFPPHTAQQPFGTPGHQFGQSKPDPYAAQPYPANAYAVAPAQVGTNDQPAVMALVWGTIGTGMVFFLHSLGIVAVLGTIYGIRALASGTLSARGKLMAGAGTAIGAVGVTLAAWSFIA